jgi:hypothetical protein
MSGKDIWTLIKRFGTYEAREKWKIISGRTDLSDFEEEDRFSFEKPKKKKNEILYLPKEYEFVLTSKHKKAKEALKYLKERGVGEEEIYFWKIGICSSGDYENRIIVPSFNVDGKLDFFVSRAYSAEAWPPYILSKVPKSEIIFNELSIDWNKEITLVEGVFDAFTAGRNSIPLLGSSIKEESKLFQKIIEKKPKLYLCLDADAKKKSLKILEKLVQYDVEVCLIWLDYEDINVIGREKFLEYREKAICYNSDNLFEQKIELML